ATTSKRPFGHTHRNSACQRRATYGGCGPPMAERQKRARGGKRRGIGAPMSKIAFREAWWRRNAEQRASRPRGRAPNLPTVKQLREFMQQLYETTGDPVVQQFIDLLEEYGLLGSMRPTESLRALREALYGSNASA